MTPTKTAKVATQIFDKLDASFPHIMPHRHDIDALEWTRSQSVAHYKYVALRILTHIEQKSTEKLSAGSAFCNAASDPRKPSIYIQSANLVK